MFNFVEQSHVSEGRTSVSYAVLRTCRMEISTIVLLFQAVWKFQYGFQQICSSFSNAKLFCIMNSYWPLFSEGSSTQFKTKLVLIGFILWHLWKSENQHSLSTVVQYQIDIWKVYCQCAKSIVLVQKYCLVYRLISPIILICTV